jgi:hypothetical protein
MTMVMASHEDVCQDKRIEELWSHDTWQATTPFSKFVTLESNSLQDCRIVDAKFL